MSNKITLSSIQSFLDEPRVAYLTTIDSLGYPHTTPVWFALTANRSSSVPGSTAPEINTSNPTPKEPPPSAAK